MPNIKYFLFDTESALFEGVSQASMGEGVIIAVAPVGAYQIKMIVPAAVLEDFYYKIFLIKDSDILGIHYVHSPEQIPDDFPVEYRQMISDILGVYFQSALANPGAKTDINHSVYTVYEEEEMTESIAQPEPLLFAYNTSLSPIDRAQSADIENALEALQKDYDKSVGIRK
jgi:hypothetical protein